jgi:hypothetical protein
LRKPAGFQQHDRPAAARHFPCRGQPGKTAADHADVDIKVER